MLFAMRIICCKCYLLPMLTLISSKGNFALSDNVVVGGVT